MPTSTVEDYLKAILQEEQRQPGDRVSTGRIAAALGVAPGTATAMMKTLADGNLVRYEPYGGVRLTEAGRRLGLAVLRRHRLVELFLVEVVGLDWSEVHSDAEQLEHAISDRLLARMDEMLGHPTVDPHGDPIPNAQGVVEDLRLPSLLTCPLNATVRIARVGDQTSEFLQWLERRALTLGSELEVLSREENADALKIRLDDGTEISLGFRTGAKILVEATAGAAGSEPGAAAGGKPA